MARSPATLTAGVARVAVAAVFIAAGALKARDPAAFTTAVDHYRLVPYPVAAGLALYVPWLEITCGVAVLWARLRLGALNLLLGLCAMFAAALASAWWRHLDIACGCFGPGAGSRPALLLDLARALALGLACAVLLGRELRDLPPEAGAA